MQLINTGDKVRFFSADEFIDYINSVSVLDKARLLKKYKYFTCSRILDLFDKVFEVEHVDKRGVWIHPIGHFITFVPEEILELVEVAR